MSAKSRFTAFIEAFPTSKRDETSIRHEAINLALSMMNDCVGSSASVEELDHLETIITVIATEIIRWPQRQMGEGVLNERELWKQKQLEIGDLVNGSPQLVVKRVQIILEESQRIMQDVWAKVENISSAGQPNELLLQVTGNVLAQLQRLDNFMAQVHILAYNLCMRYLDV